MTTKERSASNPAGPLSPEDLPAHRLLLAGRELPVRRARSTCSTTPSCGSPCARSTSSRACSGTGARHPGLNFIYAHMNRVIRELGPRRDLHHRSGPRRAGDRRERLPRGDLQRGLSEHQPRRGRDAQALPPVLVSGRDPEPRRAGDARARSTRAANSDTRSPTPTGLRSTTRTCSSAASSATARPRPARSRRAGTRTSSSTLPATARSSRSFTSTATRSPTPPCSPGSPRTSSQALMEGYGHKPYFVEGDEPAARPPAAGRGRSTRWSRRSTRSSGGPRGRRHRAAAVADDRPPDPQGLDRARRRSTGSRSRARGAPTRSRWPRSGPTPEHRHLLEDWLRSYRPEELFDDDGALDPELAALAAQELPPDEREPARQRRRAPAGPRLCPTSATTRSRSRRRARRPPRRPACSGRSCATSSERNQDELPAVRARRDLVEPARRRVRGHGPPVRRRDPADRRAPRRPTAGSWRSSPSISARAGWRATC